MNYQPLEPQELHEKLARGEPVNLIDVRELLEYEYARIAGARLLPLSQFTAWVNTLDPAEEYVFMCHHGIRSANVCMALARAGFMRLCNLTGGIDAWSREIDRSVPLY